MEKRNVMKTGVLWNEVVTQVHQREFKDVQLEHVLADSGGMQLVRWPKQFDVIVTDNLFGDMLSDIAATLTGSLGMLPSASLGEVDPKTKKRKALYEPVHGSAPDIAGKGVANPIAMIASFAMALRYSFNRGREADLIDQAIAAASAVFGATAANAQTYPDRPIRLIVPFPAGGLNDGVARVLQPSLEKSLGQPVIIDNRPAASGIVGTDAVAKAPPDGYTLLMVASSHTVVPATNSKLPYDAERDFAPIAMVGKNPLLLVVNAKVAAKTV